MAVTREIWCAFNTGGTLRLYEFMFFNKLKITYNLLDMNELDGFGCKCPYPLRCYQLAGECGRKCQWCPRTHARRKKWNHPTSIGDVRLNIIAFWW